MLRRAFLALVVVAFASSSLVAAEIRGRIKSIDPSSNTITVMVNDTQEKTIEVSKTTPVYGMVNVRRRRVALQQVGTGLTNLQTGMMVTITTETRDGMEVATQVREDNVTFSTGRGIRRRR